MNRNMASATVATALLATFGLTSAASAAPGPDIMSAVKIVEVNSQERADLIGVAAPTADAQKVDSLSFGKAEARIEQLRREDLEANDPLIAGSERLNVGPGDVSVELIDAKPLDSGHQELTIQETVNYPYLNDVDNDFMGESYERRVEVAPIDGQWKIVSNQVPEGDWPLIEGANTATDTTETMWESSMNQDGSTDSADASGMEPAEDSVGDAENPDLAEGARAASRNDAADYALRHALNYSDRYRSWDQDCTNFVSQSLRAGGFVRRNLNSSKTSQWSWWYNHYGLDSWSNSWSVAHYNYRFHINTKRGAVVDREWKTSVGDTLYADWTNNGYQDHVMIITGSDPETGKRVSGHTSNRRNVDMTWWMTKGRESEPNVDYDYMHLTWGKF